MAVTEVTQLVGLEFSVHGLPAPQGSKRHVGNGVMVESSAGVKPWREDVKLAALRALKANPRWDRNLTHVGMFVVFALPRPRYHYGTGKNSRRLKTSAPTTHGTKPDLDKLVRSTLDALGSAGVFVDDSRVSFVQAVKTYPDGWRNLGHTGALIQLEAVRL